MPGTPSDWVSGERVFAPPRGTVDVDWLVPAVLELVPEASAAQARAALERAWSARRRADAPPAPTDGAPGGAGDAADPLVQAADQVLAEALDTFGA